MTEKKQESVCKEEEEAKHCHLEEWNVFANEMLNINFTS